MTLAARRLEDYARANGTALGLFGSSLPRWSPSCSIPSGEVFILDDDDLGSRVAHELRSLGRHAVACSLDTDVESFLNDDPPGSIAVNLAPPTAWRTVRRLTQRRMARRLPSFGYVLPNSAAAGTWLGTVDFLTLPVANARAVETLHALVPDVASVMVVSGDLDVTMDLRAELSGSGIDLAVVDARTAIELCSSEPPDAVILHVSPTSSDSFRVLAAVHTHTSANIPIVFLMDPVAQPREEAFLSAGTSLIAEYGRLRPDELARRLASDLAAQPVVPSH